MFRSPLATKDVTEERQPATLVEPVKTKDSITKAEDTGKQYSMHSNNLKFTVLFS